MSRTFDLPEAEWATVGAVGEPGHRTFYLQARQDAQLLTLKLEKQHVAAIAQFLSEILEDLPATGNAEAEGTEALVEPVLAEWPVGTVQIAYDSASDRIIILAEELGTGDDDLEVEDDEELRATGEPDFDPITMGHPSRRGEPPAERSDDPVPEEEDRGVARLGISRATAAQIVRVGVDLIGAGRPACHLCGRPMDPEGHTCPRTNGHKPN